MKKRAKKTKVRKKVVKKKGGVLVCEVCRGPLYWIPRILAILFILFISLFTLDVFGEGYGFPEVLVALFMHLLPTLALIVLTVVAWKWEKVGGWLFVILGVVFTVFFKTYGELIGFLLISGPVFLIGILFLVGYYKKEG
ncbi:MAG: hypothetical protein ABIH92_05705 [Nanoarchaeota archaeon]